MNTTAQDYKIKCQKKGCRNHVNWKVSAPTWNKTGYDVLLIPIGFCTIEHLITFFTNEYNSFATKALDFKRFGVKQ